MEEGLRRGWVQRRLGCGEAGLWGGLVEGGLVEGSLGRRAAGLRTGCVVAWLG